jgi:predicted dehydrogenase
MTARSRLRAWWERGPATRTGLRLRGPADISGSPRTRARTAFAAARALPRGIGELIGGGVYVRSYAEEWRHFLACVRGEARLASTLADGRGSARVAIAAVRSAREGVAIELSPASTPERSQRV